VLGEQLAQLHQDLRDARRREAEATERAAHSAEEADKLERELGAANSKAAALQASHAKLQEKVGAGAGADFGSAATRPPERRGLRGRRPRSSRRPRAPTSARRRRPLP
jgi:hypothetical protein